MALAHKLFTSLQNYSNPATRIGELNRIWYDSVNNVFRIQLDTVTPGGTVIDSKVGLLTSLSLSTASNTTVTGIYRTGGGANYTSFPTITISAPTGAGGVQATASLLYMLNVGIYSITSAGSGYTVGDVVTMTGGTLYGASVAGTFRVATINGSGGVTGLNTPNYTAYSVLPANPTIFSGGTGTGLQATVVYALQGASFNITNAGSGYVAIPTVTFSGGGVTPTPTQATAIVIVGNSNSQIQTPNAGLSFLTASGENLRILDQSPLYTYNQNSPQNTNFISLWGNQTGIEPVIRSYGTSDANVNLQLATSGTGNINFFTNYQNASGSFYARQQFQISSTANAANYIQVTGSITGTNPILSVQGTDATRSLQLTSKGTTFVYLQNNNGTVTHFSAGGTSAAVNYLNARGMPTGSGTQLEAVGTDSTIGLTLQMKGAGVLQVNSGGMNLLKASQTFSSVSWSGSSATRTDNNATAPDGSTTAALVQATAVLYGGLVRQYMSAPYLYASYATYTMSFYAKAGTWNYVGLRMSNGQAGASDAYPYFNLSTGTATNVSPTTGTTFNVGMTAVSGYPGWYRCYASYTTAAVTNSITDIAITSSAGSTSFTPAGTETVYIWGAQLEFGSVMNTYLVTTTTPVYNTPSIGFSNNSGLNIGMQSDGSLYLMNGGFEGALQAQATTNGTPVGGNARGLGAVDWQMRRGSAGNVASGQESVIGGGYGNTVSGLQSVVVGGAANTNSGGSSFIGAGVGNSTSGLSSMVLAGGGYNTTNSYYSFIGGGSYNTAGVYSAATTQTTTTLGIVATSTTVTLSSSNSSIRVGMMVFGGGVSYPNYVTAIVGTTLTIATAATASSSTAVTLNFFETHNVVVGGANNQATGSYSFIGGGGDAGTASNRNVASGDWSVVGGGNKNTASAIYATVVGGISNTSAGQGSFIGGGGWYGSGVSSNTSFGTSSFVGAGYGNSCGGFAGVIVGGTSNAQTNSIGFIGGGNNNTCNALNATISGGSYGTTRSIEGNTVFPAHASPIAAALGVSQGALLILGVQTTDATATVLRSNTSAAGTTNQVILPNNSAYYFRGEIVAGVTGGGNTKGWYVEGVIKRGAGVGTTAIVGTATVTSNYADAGASTWALTATADTTNGGLAITFTGQASTTIRCVAQIRTTEMTY